MKKFLILLVLVSSQVFAASSGTLILTGFVPVLNEITVTPTNAVLNLQTEVNKILVANVVEKSNNLKGYTISMSSSNGGNLKHDTDNSLVPYTITYNNTDFNLKTTPTVVKNVLSLSQLTTTNMTVQAQVTPNPNLLAGTYTDSIVISIAAN